VVTGSTTRENLYVAMTRGRESNMAYVALDRPDDSHAAPTPEDVTAKTILYGVLKHSGAELSAHQTIDDEQEYWSSFAQVAAEYLTIAAEAQRDRWVAELSTSGLTDEQVDAVLASDSFGPLAAELRRAESSGGNIAKALPQVVAQRSLDDAEDIGAVLISRLRHATAGPRRRGTRQERLIAGLIPIADGPMPDEMRRGLTERQSLLEQRASAVVEAAVAGRAAWARKLGTPPLEQSKRARWMAEVRVVAAYRDLYGIDSDTPLGPPGMSDRQRVDAARARKALRRATDIAEVGVTGRSYGFTPDSPVLT
jgi:hypothetical protein